MIVKIPLCVDKFGYIYKAACFVQKQFVEFSQQMVKFLKDELTPQKLMFGLKNFCEFINSYQKQLSVMNADDLLTHIVNNTGILPHDVSNEVKNILCGDHMRALLRNKFPKKASDKNFIKFCVEHVMKNAGTIRRAYNEVVAECESHGLDGYSHIEQEFCQVYGLNQCDMSEFVLRGIREIAQDMVSFSKAYEEHCSKPENRFEELLVASHAENSRTIHTFSTVPPCNALDEGTCTNFAQTFDQRNHEYSSYSFVQPQPNVSILFSASSFSTKMVIFVTDKHNGNPSLNISFYRDSQASVNNRLQ